MYMIESIKGLTEIVKNLVIFKINVCFKSLPPLRGHTCKFATSDRINFYLVLFKTYGCIIC